MPWKKMLAYVTGEVDQSLLARVEYLIEENRVVRNQIEKRILLTDGERKILAEKAVPLGRLMADTVTIVMPETFLKRHRAFRRQEKEHDVVELHQAAQGSPLGNGFLHVRDMDNDGPDNLLRTVLHPHRITPGRPRRPTELLPSLCRLSAT